MAILGNTTINGSLNINGVPVEPGSIPTIPDITVNNGGTESGKYISQVAVDATNKHKLNITKENLPIIPTISTSITNDATSDTKTASPKAVKTYVDNALGDIETLLGAI